MKFESEITLKEFCSKQRAKWMMVNIEKIPVRESTDPCYDPKQSILNYCGQILKTKNGVLNQKYITKTGYGRLYLAEGRIGYQNIMREYRSLLCGGDYYDVDIKNCHPVLLEQYCKSKGLECGILSYYIEKRDKIRNKFMSFGISKDDVKTQFIAVIFGQPCFNKDIKKKDGPKILRLDR